jgi:hypothetical protein
MLPANPLPSDFAERIPFQWNRASLTFSLFDHICLAGTGIHPRIKSERMLRLKMLSRFLSQSNRMPVSNLMADGCD